MYYNYNRIKLLQFRIHISAELLLLSKKVIYLLTSAFDVFHGLPCLSPFFHPVFCSSFAISWVTGWTMMCSIDLHALKTGQNQFSVEV